MNRESELNWFKSSYSGPSDNDCVEVAATPVTVHVRDSKDVQLSHLGFGAGAWADFVSYASEG
ncbi:DUF397 domain-containing protein [Streptomyces sp. NPDC088258]|uniref:DUF397 domain-containing protein n=1 Tax=Streptomyces sp. NPDC088258 TaxID=3365849 RepID=UPI0037F3DDF7